jgi:nucleotide-binding universal stress UspA family protein
MFDTIIVPLDMSRHAEEALPFAIEEARHHDARLVLLQVIPRPELPETAPQIHRCGPAPKAQAWPERALAEATAVAATYLSQLTRRYDLAPDTVTRIVVGEPARRIRAEVDAWPKAMVVLTTGDCTDHPRSPLSEVARQLLVSGQAPILGIRHTAPSPRPLRMEDRESDVLALHQDAGGRGRPLARSAVR